MAGIVSFLLENDYFCSERCLTVSGNVCFYFTSEFYQVFVIYVAISTGSYGSKFKSQVSNHLQ